MKDDGNAWFEIKKCPECGKGFTVLYPQLWAYKRGLKNHDLRYFCSWKCMRADERTGDTLKKIMSKEELLDACIAEIQAGRHPYEMLKEMGYKAPAQAWASVRHWARDHKSPKLEMLPENLQKWMREKDRKEPETEKDEPEEAKAEVHVVDRVPEVAIDGAIRMRTADPGAVKLVYDETIAEEYRREQEAKKDREDGRKVCAPVKYEGMTVREVEGEYGRYRLKVEYGSQCIGFESLEGDKISMRPWEWAEFMKEMRKAAAILGVGMDEA